MNFFDFIIYVRAIFVARAEQFILLFIIYYYLYMKCSKKITHTQTHSIFSNVSMLELSARKDQAIRKGYRVMTPPPVGDCVIKYIH